MHPHFLGGGNKRPTTPRRPSLREVAVAETTPPVCRHALGRGAGSGPYIRRHRGNGTPQPGGRLRLRLRGELPFGANTPPTAPRTPARALQVYFFPFHLGQRRPLPAQSTLAMFASALCWSASACLCSGAWRCDRRE
jgi:hypothetical protein